MIINVVHVVAHIVLLTFVVLRRAGPRRAPPRLCPARRTGASQTAAAAKVQYLALRLRSRPTGLGLSSETLGQVQRTTGCSGTLGHLAARAPYLSAAKECRGCRGHTARRGDGDRHDPQEKPQRGRAQRKEGKKKKGRGPKAAAAARENHQ